MGTRGNVAPTPSPNADNPVAAIGQVVFDDGRRAVGDELRQLRGRANSFIHGVASESGLGSHSLGGADANGCDRGIQVRSRLSQL